MQSRLFFPFFALVLFLLFPVYHVSADQNVNVQSAFLFAERGDWDNALAHARRSGDSALLKLITWRYLQDVNSRASFDEIAEFMHDHPHWPQQARLTLRAEQALRYSEPPDTLLVAWFAANPPVSGIGKIKQAELLMRIGADLRSENVQLLIRDGWRSGDFEENEEQRLLAVYGDFLREQDHIARADRLLWEEKTRAAQRMLPLLPEGQRKLALARIALLEESREASFRLAHVPRALMNDPGLIHARLQWRAKRKDEAGMREMLLTAPTPVPYPEKWWKYREQAIREAILDGNPARARKLIANHGQTEGQEHAEAAWLAGWLALEFANDPQSAYEHFYHMFESVRFPVSKARAAYWAARAAGKAGDAETSTNWYTTAASWPTTFYGQLALLQLPGKAKLMLPSDPQVSAEEAQHFAENDLVRAIRLAAGADEDDLAGALLSHLVDTAPSPAQAALVARLGTELRGPFGVRAAKRALQRNIVLGKTGYPRPPLPASLAIEPALAYAITRQESEFDPMARSRANALGMMQLLPSTAREVARKADLPYTESKLYEAHYNITLGSHYLGRLIDAYDGSYVLAIVAYNAGPRRVREWLDTHGSPGGDTISAVNWIEKIPFSETRNYVQRVLENLQVYRALLAGRDDAALTLDEDLTR